MLIRIPADIDAQIAVVRDAAAVTAEWLARPRADPLALLRYLKFDPAGRHPVEPRPLNIIEQVNQTWTYLAALAGTRELLRLHPEAGGFRLAPGAHAAQPLDVMSVVPGLVGAETFAAVTPDSNKKLARDLAKLAGRSETFRYVFFISPAYPGSRRRHELERDGVQVWSVDVD